MVNANKHKKKSRNEMDKILRKILIPEDNPLDTRQYEMFFYFIGGVLANNGYNRIFTLIGDKCGKTTLYTIIKETLSYAQVEHKELSAKPFFIDNATDYFENYSYSEFVSNFINGNYTALCIDDLTCEHHIHLTEFFATVMEHKPLFLTMSEKEGAKFTSYLDLEKVGSVSKIKKSEW